MMKLIYKGKYDGDESKLSSREPLPGEVPFREAKDMKTFAILMNLLAFVPYIVLLPLLFWRGGWESFRWEGCLLALLCLFPHELLHGLCFREEVLLYTNLRQGMLFVTGSELFSRGRFVFMSLLPNLVFGFLPFVLFLLQPQWSILGTLGVISIGCGVGDYYNVYNALTQVPKGAIIYNKGFHSYWAYPSL